MRRLFISLLIIILSIGLYAGETTKAIISVVGMKDKSCAEKITKEIKKIERRSVAQVYLFDSTGVMLCVSH